MAKQKTVRNNHVIALRRKNPQKYTYRMLGDMFGVPHTTIIYIWQRYGLGITPTTGNTRYVGGTLRSVDKSK